MTEHIFTTHLDEQQVDGHTACDHCGEVRGASVHRPAPSRTVGLLLDRLRKVIFSSTPLRWETRIFGEYGVIVDRTGKPLNSAVDVRAAAILHNLSPALLAIAEKMSTPLHSFDGPREVLTCRGCALNWFVGEEERHARDCPLESLKRRLEDVSFDT